MKTTAELYLIKKEIEDSLSVSEIMDFGYLSCNAEDYEEHMKKLRQIIGDFKAKMKSNASIKCLFCKEFIELNFDHYDNEINICIENEDIYENQSNICDPNSPKICYNCLKISIEGNSRFSFLLEADNKYPYTLLNNNRNFMICRPDSGSGKLTILLVNQRIMSDPKNYKSGWQFEDVCTVFASGEFKLIRNGLFEVWYDGKLSWYGLKAPIASDEED